MHNLEAAKAVQRMQDYIAAHIADKITLGQLGNAAGYSPWHAAKLFKDATQISPFEYIRSLRSLRLWATVAILRQDQLLA